MTTAAAKNRKSHEGPQMLRLQIDVCSALYRNTYDVLEDLEIGSVVVDCQR